MDDFIRYLFSYMTTRSYEIVYGVCILSLFDMFENTKSVNQRSSVIFYI